MKKYLLSIIVLWFGLSSILLYKVNAGCWFPITVITTVNEYDDVRCKDMSPIDLSERPNVPATLWYNRDTIWPPRNQMPADCSPNKIMNAAKNPGLGVRALHQQGVTGEGVNVAIIDQPLLTDHPEFAGKIIAYFDTGCGGETTSMHGPAVTSLLIGNNCGTAPGAMLYYAAAPSWNLDAAYYANALDWVVEQNQTLPTGHKIRLVSVSAGPSGPGSPFTKNTYMWDEACARAEAAGIIVLDCTSHHGFIGPCWYDSNDPENITKCTPGFPGQGGMFGTDILAPCSPRTSAEEVYEGDHSYQYTGRGGLSWGIPYASGVMAMGWQLRPDLTGAEIRHLLFESTFINPGGAKIIYPRAFIRQVIDYIKGDLNDSGNVDAADFAILTGQWLRADCNSYNQNCQLADLNMNGCVDFIDISLFAANWLEKRIPSDFNLDQKVNFLDFAVLSRDWLQDNILTDIVPSPFGKGIIDNSDLKLFTEEWLQNN